MLNPNMAMEYQIFDYFSHVRWLVCTHVSKNVHASYKYGDKNLNSQLFENV